MPAKLRSSARPKSSKSMPFKRQEQKTVKIRVSETKTVNMMVSENYTRDRDLLIVTDSETEYESEVETPKPVRVRLPRKVNLKRDLDENMNEELPAKRAKISEVKNVKPKRSTRNTTRRRKMLTRAEQRKEAELEKAKRQKEFEVAANQLFDLNSTIDFMDLVNL